MNRHPILVITYQYLLYFHPSTIINTIVASFFPVLFTITILLLHNINIMLFKFNFNTIPAPYNLPLSTSSTKNVMNRHPILVIIHKYLLYFHLLPLYHYHHLHPKFICNLSSSTLKVIFDQNSSVINIPVLSKFNYTQINLLSNFILLSPFINSRNSSAIIAHLLSTFIYYQIYLLLLFIGYQRSLIIKCHRLSTFIYNQSQSNIAVYLLSKFIYYQRSSTINVHLTSMFI